MAVWTCPVCMTEGIESRTCPKCQFCHSDNFEQFPTLVRLPSSAQPLSARRAKWLAPAEQGLFACTLCGGTAFAFDLQQLALRCLQCGKQTDIDTILKQHTNIPPVLIGCSAEAREHIYEIPISHNVIAAGADFTAGIRKDGTLMITFEPWRWDYLDYGLDTSGWGNLVSVAAGCFHVLGLKKDGTVVAIGGEGIDDTCNRTARWSNIVAVSAGIAHSVGLTADGTVLVTDDKQARAVRRWKNVRATAAGEDFTVALFEDGSVDICCNDENDREKYDFSNWHNIIAICAGRAHIAGIRSDGTVVAAGRNQYGQCEVSLWSGITAIAVGEDHTVGLRKDGTVIAAGWNGYGQCNVEQWTQVVAIAASNHTVGLCKDGTVLATGRNDYGQCNMRWSRQLMLPAAADNIPLQADLAEQASAAQDMERKKHEIAALARAVKQIEFESKMTQVPAANAHNASVLH